MVKLTAFLLVLPLLVVTTEARDWAESSVGSGGTETTTQLQFYFHDTVMGKNPSAVQVAQPPDSTQYPTGFGAILMADDPLTVGPDPNSKLVGRAQGLYGLAGQQELQLIMAMSYNFIHGAYNGSSISIMGRNSAGQSVRELPVVGGTGFFRMARGYAIAHTYALDGQNAIVGYNVTLVHSPPSIVG